MGAHGSEGDGSEAGNSCGGLQPAGHGASIAARRLDTKERFLWIAACSGLSFAQDLLKRRFAMRVALFVPCYVDQLYPQVGLSALDVLEARGLTVDVPDGQTCCGQPLVNLGTVREAQPVIRQFCSVFADHEYVVCPSGSCTAMIRQYATLTQQALPPFRVYELCEFLVDVLGLESWSGRFPHRVALHQSCHGLRELSLSSPSEQVNDARPDKVRQLLEGLSGIELVELSRRDECCGFGGSFCVTESAVSERMGLDRIEDFEAARAQVVTATDMSCLMHLSGLMRRRKSSVSVMHVAEILAGRTLPDAAADA